MFAFDGNYLSRCVHSIQNCIKNNRGYTATAWQQLEAQNSRIWTHAFLWRPELESELGDPDVLVSMHIFISAHI